MTMIITITDIRAAGHCVAGARDAFNNCGADFRDFIKNGMEAETFLAMGGALAQQVVDRKIERESENGWQ